MSQNFEQILDECIFRLSIGETIDSCLEKYPHDAARLQPLLMLSSGLHQIPLMKASPPAVMAGKERLLARIYQKEFLEPVSTKEQNRYTEQVKSHSPWFRKEVMPMKLGLKIVSSLLAVLLFSGILVINASANSIPGDILYGVKRGVENVQLKITSNPEKIDQLTMKFHAERIKEITAMIHAHRTGIVKLMGIVDEVQDKEIIIDGLTVKVTEDSVVVGSLVNGAEVTINTKVSEDGTLIAVEIHCGDIVFPSALIPEDEDLPDPDEIDTDEVPEDAWVTPIPYWKTYKPTEWRTLVPTEYYTYIPTEYRDLNPEDIVATVVPTQWKTYLPSDLNNLPAPPEQWQWPSDVPSWPSNPSDYDKELNNDEMEMLPPDDVPWPWK